MKEKNMKISKISKKRIILNMSVVFFAVLVIIFGIKQVSNNDIEGEVRISELNPSWNTYVNEEYGFSIDFPSSWKVFEDSKSVSPTINIYLPKRNINPPFDHFAEINNVSIFPKGLQTEVVIGDSNKTEVDFNFDSDKSVDYVLDNGIPWATYINFANLDEPWKPWGFMWSRVVIDDLGYRCVSSGVEVGLDECNPFEGDRFIRSGVVDDEIREVQKEIIGTFKLI